MIRLAEPRDHSPIRALLLAAFPDATEADLVERLRADGFAEIELVAEEADEIIGHILFSPMEAPLRALGLAPVSVIPARQRGGVGSKLIERGHELARANGWQAIFLVGEPEYYRRFGYSLEAARPFECAYSGDYFMMLRLEQPLPVSFGKVCYPPPFAELG